MCVLLAEFLRDSLALGLPIALPCPGAGARRTFPGGRASAIRKPAADRRVVRGADACLVPPLLLQPIRGERGTHGVAHVLSGGTVRVAASRSGSTLSIVVENPCDPDRPRAGGTGVGLANVRARLRALHGTEARVTASEHDGTWRVELALPAQTQTP